MWPGCAGWLPRGLVVSEGAFACTLRRPPTCCSELSTVSRMRTLLHTSAVSSAAQLTLDIAMQATGTALSAAPAILHAAGGASSAGGRGEGLSALYLPAGRSRALSC